MNMKRKKQNGVIIGRGEKIFLIINNVLMILLMLITVYPMLYVLFASFSDPIKLGTVNGLLLKPVGFSLRGYQAVLQSANIWIGFRNTIFYVIVGTVFSLTITILGAYPFSRNFMLKRPLMLLCIFTMYFEVE